MRYSNIAVVALLIVIVAVLFQLNKSFSNTFGDWMIESSQSGSSNFKGKNHRTLVEVKAKPSMKTIVNQIDIDLNTKSEEEEEKPTKINIDVIPKSQEEKPIEKAKEEAKTKEPVSEKVKETANSDPTSKSGLAETKSVDTEVEPKPVDTAVDQKVEKDAVKSEIESVGKKADSDQDTEKSDVLRFHLIVTRFVNDTSILQFNRPEQFSSSNYLHQRTLESIFYHHPKADVTIHTNVLEDGDFAQFVDTGYTLRVTPLKFEELAAGTPLEGATRGPKWKVWEASSRWYAGFSDLYRLIVLWKLGGVYVDTDMVITKPFDGLDRAVGFQDPGRVFLNCAIAVFRRPGSPFVLAWMKEAAAHFNGGNGAQLLTRAWRRWEDRAERDAVIQVQDQPKFYMFYHRDAKHHCFNNSMAGEQRLAYAKTLAARVPYAVHLSSKAAWLVKKELIPGTFCHYLVTRYCIFCDADPPKPPSYPAIDEGGEHVELP